MFEAVRDFATRNAWASPEQDNQIILAAKKISKPFGVINTMKIMNRVIDLPANGKFYHVYQVGQVYPALLGLLNDQYDWTRRSWQRFDTSVNDLPLFVDIYTNSGVHVPLLQAHWYFTEERAFIFAVEIQPQVAINFETEQIYLRLYTNAYYRTEAGDALLSDTSYVGCKVLTTSNIIATQSAVAILNEQPGYTFQFVNGKLVSLIDVISAQVGDYIEAIHDASVKRVVSIPIHQLSTFFSELDSTSKYLFHYLFEGDKQIDFIDDIDVYIVRRISERYEGFYLHRNQFKNIRMVTHRDYSLSVDTVYSIGSKLQAEYPEEIVDVLDFEVMLVIRNNGLDQPLPYEANRIFELYKLDDTKVKAALNGIDANMSKWYAPNLEGSDFTRLIRSFYKDISPELIEGAFGYNAISKILADGPLTGGNIAGNYVFDLPVGLQTTSTIYEYDADGYLLGYYNHGYGASHLAYNPSARLIEGIVGDGRPDPSVFFGTTSFTIPLNASFRLYHCYVVNGEWSHEWIDVTDQTDNYTVVGNTLTWTSPDTDFILMLRTDARFLAYEMDLQAVGGTFYFDLVETSGGEQRIVPVPPGELDIWMNGKSLIRNLDYFVKFPRVFIVNKEYLTQPALSTAQKVVIRATGFCLPGVDNKTFTLREKRDAGFIEFDVLSNNNRYNLRDDKVLRITVKGKLEQSNSLIFSELHSGVSIELGENGQPYEIKDVLVPLRGETSTKTYLLKAISSETDLEVENYMSLKLPEPERAGVSPVNGRHILYSPFFAHIIADVKTRYLEHSKLEQRLTDNVVIDICKDYEPLLAFDPIMESSQIDHRFVLVHPHLASSAIELDVYQYNFMKQVVRLYGKGKIQISGFLSISSNGV